MPRYRVKKCYWLAHRDLVVMTGTIVDGPVLPGMFINLPTQLRGPGLVPIASMEEVEFPTHKELAVVIEYRELEPAPMFEPSTVEGRVLDVVSSRDD